jgi:amino acid transporter
VNLVTLGIGAIIGAGIFVVPGTVAANLHRACDGYFLP